MASLLLVICVIFIFAGNTTALFGSFDAVSLIYSVLGTDPSRCPSGWVTSSKGNPCVCLYLSVNNVTSGTTYLGVENYCKTKIDVRSTMYTVANQSEYDTFQNSIGSKMALIGVSNIPVGIYLSSGTTVRDLVTQNTLPPFSPSFQGKCQFMAPSNTNTNGCLQTVQSAMCTVKCDNEPMPPPPIITAGTNRCNVANYNSACPSGWLNLGGLCYKNPVDSNTLTTYSEAANLCKAAGGWLPEFVNLNEWNAVVNYAYTTGISGSASYAAPMWLGGQVIGATPTWTDGTAWSFSYWAPNQPDLNKSCLRWSVGNANYWSTGDCTTPGVVFCQYYACPTTTSTTSSTKKTTTTTPATTSMKTTTTTTFTTTATTKPATSSTSTSTTTSATKIPTTTTMSSTTITHTPIKSTTRTPSTTSITTTPTTTSSRTTITSKTSTATTPTTISTSKTPTTTSSTTTTTTTPKTSETTTLTNTSTTYPTTTSTTQKTFTTTTPTTTSTNTTPTTTSTTRTTAPITSKTTTPSATSTIISPIITSSTATTTPTTTTQITISTTMSRITAYLTTTTSTESSAIIPTTSTASTSTSSTTTPLTSATIITPIVSSMTSSKMQKSETMTPATTTSIATTETGKYTTITLTNVFNIMFAANMLVAAIPTTSTRFFQTTSVKTNPVMSTTTLTNSSVSLLTTLVVLAETPTTTTPTATVTSMFPAMTTTMSTTTTCNAPPYDFSKLCERNASSFYSNGTCYQLNAIGQNCDTTAGYNPAIIRSADVAEELLQKIGNILTPPFSFYIGSYNNDPTKYRDLDGSVSSDGKYKIVVDEVGGQCMSFQWAGQSSTLYTISDHVQCGQNLQWICEKASNFKQVGCNKALTVGQCAGINFTVANVFECAVQCATTVWCSGINFEAAAGHCNLLMETSSTQSLFCQSGVDYYERQ